MSMDIKPIQTFYNGCYFRSRLEARYAVLFDCLGIKWEYELEGYTLSDGSRYPPDFWLPKFDGAGMFVEVKGEFTQEEINKCKLLCSDTKRKVWLAEGTPDLKAWKFLYKYNGKVEEFTGIPMADQAWDEYRVFVEPGYENQDISIPQQYHQCLGNLFIESVTEARSKRFEFNGK